MNLVEHLSQMGLADKLFTNNDLKRVLKGTSASRYALVNKALHKGHLIQLKRGVYVLPQKYTRHAFSQFYIASQMIPHSYVSFESALSFHGWIPERVSCISSVIHQGRTKSFNTPLGEFQYFYLPTNEFEFLTCVSRNKVENQPFLIAQPLRALMDLIYEKKIQWQGLDFLTESLRIEMDNLLTLQRVDFNMTKRIYRSKRVLAFIQQLEDSILRYEPFNYPRKIKGS